MLNQNHPGSDDDDDSGSDYVLLEAEEPEDELTEEPQPETEPLLAPDAAGGLVEQASEQLLEPNVDEKVKASVEDENKEDGLDILKDEAEKEEEKSIADEPEEESKLPSSSSDGKEPEEAVGVQTKGFDVTKLEEPETYKPPETYNPEYPIGHIENNVAEAESEPILIPELAEGSQEHSGSEKDDKSVDGIRSEGEEEVEDLDSNENKSKADTTTYHSTGDEETDPEEAEATKENAGVAKAKQDLGSREYKYGTRREVNGAAAVFGVTGFMIGGPIVGVLSAVASAHIAANKPCQCATFTRRCGGVLGNIGNKKQPAAAPQEKKPHLWDKITDRLVEGGEWTEHRLAPLRRIKPLNHKYGSKSKSMST
jgi:hypothetical protein